jgi:putative photosynthetic complex assembly protein 2
LRVADHVLPAIFALFVWWGSTGLVIYLDGLPRWTFRLSMTGATVLFVAALFGLARSSGDATVRGAYIAFSCGLLAWAWLEISFYTGYVTGPRKTACPEGCAGWRHFGHAIWVSLYHELAIVAATVLVVGVTWCGENQIGTWTFIALWWMHESARLNVFLGVRNLNEEFLPVHLLYLKSFFANKPMNLLFPVSVTASTLVTFALAQNAAAASSGSYEAVGYSLLAALMVLAVLEHWFLVVPLPTGALWSWGLTSRSQSPSQSLAAACIDEAGQQRSGGSRPGAACDCGAGSKTFDRDAADAVEDVVRSYCVKPSLGGTNEL